MASLTKMSARCGLQLAGVNSLSWLHIRETAVSNASLGRGPKNMEGCKVPVSESVGEACFWEY
jgi:hypothetical protein